MRPGFFIETTGGRLWFSTTAVDSLPLQISNPSINRDTVLGLIEGWTCLLADSPLNSTSKSMKPPKVFHRWFKFLTSRPIKDTIVEFSKLSHRLVSQPTLFGSGSSTGDWIPEFTDLPVFKEYNEWFKSGDPVLLQYLYTFLNFGKKLKYVDADLESTAFRGWTGVEERLHDLQLPTHMTRAMREIMERLIGPLNLSRDFGPRFGPGRVSEPGVFGNIEKSCRVLYDAKIDRAFFRSHFVSYGLQKELGYHIDRIIPDAKKWNRASEHSRRYSRLKFVPKDMTKSRSICAEPNTYMFFQQGLADLLVSGMNKSLARRFVSIDDQSRNRYLALYGSMTGEIDTIDLSAASDSVSIDLVKQLFPRDWLFFLLATRTAKVQVPDGRIIEVKKFAPMGSALCFPVQCLVFTAVVIYAAMLESGGHSVGQEPGEAPFRGEDIDRFVSEKFRRTPSYVPPDRATYQPAAVYGDDICVDQRLTPYVFHILTSLGFEVNTSKSFTGSQCFRESCGGYYYMGDDVTPLFYRVEGAVRGSYSYGSVASRVSLANHAGDRGYSHVRRSSIQHLLFDNLKGVRPYKGTNPIRFSNDRDTGLAIYTANARNTHLKTRSNFACEKSAYQTDEVLCAVVSTEEWVRPSGLQSDGLERYLYLQWWNSHRGATTAPFTGAAPRRDPSGSRLRVKWTHA